MDFYSLRLPSQELFVITISGVVCREAGGEKRGGRADDLCFYDKARLFLKTEVLHARSPKGGPGSIFRQK